MEISFQLKDAEYMYTDETGKVYIEHPIGNNIVLDYEELSQFLGLVQSAQIRQIIAK